MGMEEETKCGAGALWYRWTDGIAFTSYYLHSVKEVADAEKWLRERLAAGEIDPSVSYLTRWNKKTKQVEIVLGNFYVWPKDPESSQ
jgi:hypothetical protein